MGKCCFLLRNLIFGTCLVLFPVEVFSEWSVKVRQAPDEKITTASGNTSLSISCSIIDDRPPNLYMVMSRGGQSTKVPTDYSVTFEIDDDRAFRFATKVAINSNNIMFYDISNQTILDVLRRGNNVTMYTSFGDTVYIQDIDLKGSWQAIGTVISACSPKPKRMERSVPVPKLSVLDTQELILKEAERRIMWYIDNKIEIIDKNRFEEYEELLNFTNAQ